MVWVDKSDTGSKCIALLTFINTMDMAGIKVYTFKLYATYTVYQEFRGIVLQIRTS